MRSIGTPSATVGGYSSPFTSKKYGPKVVLKASKGRLQVSTPSPHCKVRLGWLNSPFWAGLFLTGLCQDAAAIVEQQTKDVLGLAFSAHNNNIATLLRAHSGPQ